eukprot:TRINITY_DN4893_c0_g1_i1.p1 TRINITY_DN4893_c0_g1~~TRINITY_DN4893_c0_g1_i1.p1  ORF type:complete len:567 (-),score=149.77 TRINITY_DN4893_c0_g1_i1:371-2071(-)
MFIFYIVMGFACLWFFFFFFQAEDGIRDAQESRGLGDVYKRQVSTQSTGKVWCKAMGNVRSKLSNVLSGPKPETSELLTMAIVEPIQSPVEAYALDSITTLLGHVALQLSMEQAHGALLQLQVGDGALISPSKATLEASGFGQGTEFKVVGVEAAQAQAAETVDIFQAVRHGKVAVLRNVVRHCQHRVVDQVDSAYERTALHWAAEKDQPEVAELLFESRADLNAKDKFHETALHRAVRSQSRSVAQLLIAQSTIDLNPTDRNGRTPLYWAKGAAAEAVLRASQGRASQDPGSLDDMIALLVEAGAADLDPLPLPSRNRSQPNHCHDDPHSHGDQEADGQPPLQLNQVEVCGIEEAPKLPKDHPHEIDLLEAVKKGMVPEVEWVVAYQPDRIHHTDSAYERTALHWAAEKDRPEMAHLLVEAHADPNIKDKFGESPLHRAVRSFSIDTVRILLHKASAHPSPTDRNDRTPLYWAKQAEAQAYVESASSRQMRPANKLGTADIAGIILLLQQAGAKRDCHDSHCHDKTLQAKEDPCPAQEEPAAAAGEHGLGCHDSAQEMEVETCTS